MRTLRDFFISFITAVGITAFFRSFQQRPLVRVIVFHDVLDEAWFERTLSVLTERYRVLTPESFFKKEFDASRINILLTFDDGYASWTEACLPVLSSMGLKALFFVNSGLIDSHGTESQVRYVKENLLLSPRKTLSWGTLRLLVAKGHAVGGHARSHRKLSTLSAEAQREDIVSDKKKTEKMTGVSLTAFAYPFGNRGDFTEKTQSLAQEAGYTHIFSTEAGFWNGDPLSIPRLCLEEDMNERPLREWVEGGYDVYAKIKRLCVR